MGTMTNYDYIKMIENDMTFLQLLKKGFIPISILDKKVIYERYKQEKSTNGHLLALTHTADYYNISEMTVRRAVKFMEN